MLRLWAEAPEPPLSGAAHRAYARALAACAAGVDDEAALADTPRGVAARELAEWSRAEPLARARAAVSYTHLTLPTKRIV